jgi:hypothetical protein
VADVNLLPHPNIEKHLLFNDNELWIVGEKYRMRALMIIRKDTLIAVLPRTKDAFACWLQSHTQNFHTWKRKRVAWCEHHVWRCFLSSAILMTEIGRRSLTLGS